MKIERNIKLGKKLKKARLKRHLSQKELSEKIGMSQSTYSSYECGARSCPVVKFIDIADALNMSIDEVINPPESEEVNKLYKSILDIPVEELLEVLTLTQNTDIDKEVYLNEEEFIDYALFDWAGLGVDISNKITEQGQELIKQFVASVMSNPYFLKENEKEKDEKIRVDKGSVD